jgi:hypothetical protein
MSLTVRACNKPVNRYPAVLLQQRPVELQIAGKVKSLLFGGIEKQMEKQHDLIPIPHNDNLIVMATGHFFPPLWFAV